MSKCQSQFEDIMMSKCLCMPCEIMLLRCATTEPDGLQCSGYLYLCVPCLMCRKLLNHNGGHDKYSYLSIETDYRLPDLLVHLTGSRDRHSPDTDTLQTGAGWGQASTQITTELPLYADMHQGRVLFQYSIASM